MAAGTIDPIPMDKWSMKSRSDRESNLLQGVRISNEFINALMWMETRYLRHQKIQCGVFLKDLGAGAKV